MPWASSSNLLRVDRWQLEENIRCTTSSINQPHSIILVYLQNAFFMFFPAQRMPNDTSKNLKVVSLGGALFADNGAFYSLYH